ncbi:LLM class flavin-dependent oxidoreductase [Zoogloea sp. LCSB751]|uniref:LLM class flavin-dependent oxidoreductase n=1 Tax=Zoogloea sp. LCSB751 TaxID=1965277 RepID=UPI0009A48ED5|nr:LLM class flavin-dependent oxidoreductase [Zoogloea sp. LCSB751]
MKVLWYISPVDGRYPWLDAGRYPVDHHRLRRLADLLDRAGYFGALVGTYAHDVFTTVTSLFPFTEKLRFLIPVYPGVTPPALLAQQALTFDDYSGGRLLFNLVNGTDNTLAQYGVHAPHDERYELSAEYWQLFKKLYAGETVRHKGKYFNLASLGDREFQPTQLPLGPVQAPNLPLWGAGASPAGLKHAAQVVDTYLAFLQRPEKLREQFTAAKAAAAAEGRRFTLGVLTSVIVRNTEEEALAHFQWLLRQSDPVQLAKQIHVSLENRVGVPGGLERLSSDNPQTQARIEALRSGRLPTLDELRVHTNTYAGLAPWNQFDLLDKGPGTYIVGNPRQVAERLFELRDDFGVDAFILSGWPLIEEAQWVKDLLLPLLPLEHPAPVLARPRA